MQVFHTAGVPPSTGSSMRAQSGCTTISSPALTSSVTANRMNIGTFRTHNLGRRASP
jgi:hypothetical protein